MSNRIVVEENANRVKIIVPLKRLWPFWLAYTVLLIGWFIGSIWAIRTLFAYAVSGNVGFEGGYFIAWIVILVIITFLWYYVGRMIWRRWQYYSANREILFFYPDKLIVRRPLSLLGVTEAYDRQFVSLFRYDGKVESAAFDYGSFRVPVGATLPVEESHALVALINERFFADQVAEQGEYSFIE